MKTTTSGARENSKRSTGKSFWLGALVGVLVALIVPLVVLATGALNMGATQEPGAIERSVASLALNASVAIRAPELENPFAGDAAAVETGMAHFRDTCLLCHGAPGIEPQEFARGLNPDPPELSTVLADWSDGELFWLTRHGIRMTGMPAFGPTHSDDDLWRIVAFVRQLPHLTASQQNFLKDAAQPVHRHGESGHGESGHGESEHGESEHGESGHGESGHGSSGHGEGEGTRSATSEGSTEDTDRAHEHNH